VSEARKNSGSELVRKLAEERGTGFGMTSSPDEIERETLSLRISMATLKAKAPQEADAYRTFVLEVAESVGAAARGGETAEAGALERIRSGLDGERGS
jgi:arginine/ornithine N-succinyltransferase beta subunit